MSGIFGLVNLDGAPVDPAHIEAMRAAMAHWGPDGTSTLVEGAAGFGQCLLYNTPEALHERLPRRVGPGWLFTAEARIDNRDELCDFFRIPSAERPTTPDSELMWLAYQKWGEESPEHLLGDWSFAVWRPEERRLFLARDHHGQTALYTTGDHRRLAFASDRRALCALPAFDRRVNERFIARILVSSPAVHGSETALVAVERLPPAHCLTGNPSGVRRRQYWRLEDIREVVLQDQRAYVDWLSQEFDTAVRCRLRSMRPVAVALSSGLDSASVCASAIALWPNGVRDLTAFTWVPAHAYAAGTPSARIGNEWDLARQVTQPWPDVAHRAVDAAGVTPLDGLRFMLSVHSEPMRGPGLYGYLAATSDELKAMGAGVVLNGMAGNGVVPSVVRPVGPRARARTAAYALRDRIWPPLGAQRQHADALVSVRESAIHPRLVDRIGIETLYDPMTALQYPEGRPNLPYRLRALRPGQANQGSHAAEWGAASGTEWRDPFVDVRVLAVAFAVPTRFATGPLNRWLMRQAMSGRLPAAVRENEQRGMQAADLVPRLRLERAALVACLAEFSGTAVEEYLDVARMAGVAAALDAPSDVTGRNRAAFILLRGIGVGQYLRSLA